MAIARNSELLPKRMTGLWMKGGPWPYSPHDIPSDWYEVAVGPKDDPESALNDCGVIKNVAQKIQKYLENFGIGDDWSWRTRDMEILQELYKHNQIFRPNSRVPDLV